MKRIGLAIVTVPVVFALVACGGEKIPPKSLTDARAELARAKQGIALQLNPTDVHEADLAMQKAESAWEDEPDDPTTADLALIAQRKAQIAQTEAAAMQSEKDAEAAKAEREGAINSQLQAARGQLDKTSQALNKTQAELQAEQAAATEQKKKLAELEAKLKDARDTIAKIAAVKDDDRGMVITLSGEVLFKTGKYDLKPAAMAKLDQIADALRGKEQPIVIYGFTDNVGSRDSNMDLSLKRATSVKDYFVSKGIPQDLLSAQGKGPDDPVSDNTSVEGRAANRRVEIVVKPKNS